MTGATGQRDPGAGGPDGGRAAQALGWRRPPGAGGRDPAVRAVGWSRAPGCVHRRIGGDVLVAAPAVEGEEPRGRAGETGDVSTLQGAAAVVWMLLEAPARWDDLVGALVGALADGDLVGLAPEAVAAAVDEALTVLARAGLVAAIADPA